MREDFEKWWRKQKEYHYPSWPSGTCETLKELAWKSWQAGIRSIEPDGLGCETF